MGWSTNKKYFWSVLCSFFLHDCESEISLRKECHFFRKYFIQPLHIINCSAYNLSFWLVFVRWSTGDDQDPRKKGYTFEIWSGLHIKVVKWYTFYIWPVLRENGYTFQNILPLKMIKYLLTKALNLSSMNICTISF